MPISEEGSSSIAGRFLMFFSGWKREVVERRRRD